MKTILAILLIVTALAGCSDEPAPEPVAVPDPTPTPSNETVVAELRLTLDATEVVLQGNDTATLSGTVSEGAIVAITYDRDLGGVASVVNGTWSYAFPVDFGHTPVEIFADDGTNTATLSAMVKRNMLLTVEIDHDTAQGKVDRVDTFYWDHGSMRSMADPSYEGCDQPHPERPNAHDALLDYTDIVGVPVTYTECGSFGVSVDDVDDVDYGPLGWCFTVNGEAAEFGISLLELQDGDIFAFQNCGGLF